MADAVTPRLPGQPPPLPESFRPREEPFPPEEKAPDTLRLGAAIPRVAPLLPPPDPLTETTAALLRQELALHREVMRESLPTQPVLPIPPAPGLPSLEPASLRTMTKRRLAALGGTWTLAFTLLALALPIAAKKWPAYADLIEYVRSLLP